MNAFFIPSIRDIVKAYALILAVLVCAHFDTAHAQNPGSGPIPNSNNAGQFGSPFNTKNGHAGFGAGLPPALNAACGTGPVAPVGTDVAFTFKSGTSTGATCTITPNIAYALTPSCSVDSQAGSVAYTVTPSGSILLTGVADSTVYNVLCFAQPGGF